MTKKQFEIGGVLSVLIAGAGLAVVAAAADVPTTIPSVAPTTMATTVPATMPAIGMKIPDLRYGGWTKFKIGSNCTLVGEMTVQGLPVHMKMVQTLTKINPDSVEVETKSTVTFAGSSYDATAQTETITATTDDELMVLTGLKDLTAAGRTFGCRVLESTGTPDKNPGIKKATYVSTDVPGGVVQMDVTDATGKTMSLKLTAIDIK